MRKIIVFAFCFCVFFCQQSMAQDVSRWSGSARLEMTGGLNYHFGADVLIDGSGAMTVKLTREFDSMLLPLFLVRVQLPAILTLGVSPYSGYWDGQRFKIRYCIVLQAEKFQIVITPGDFAIQAILANNPISRAVTIRLNNGFPDSCTAGNAFFGAQTPCEADASIVIQ